MNQTWRILPHDELDIVTIMSHLSQNVCNGKLVHHKSGHIKVIFVKKKWQIFIQVFYNLQTAISFLDVAIKGKRSPVTLHPHRNNSTEVFRIFSILGVSLFINVPLVYDLMHKELLKIQLLMLNKMITYFKKRN